MKSNDFGNGLVTPKLNWPLSLVFTSSPSQRGKWAEEISLLRLKSHSKACRGILAANARGDTDALQSHRQPPRLDRLTILFQTPSFLRELMASLVSLSIAAWNAPLRL